MSTVKPLMDLAEALALVAAAAAEIPGATAEGTTVKLAGASAYPIAIGDESERGMWVGRIGGVCVTSTSARGALVAAASEVTHLAAKLQRHADMTASLAAAIAAALQDGPSPRSDIWGAILAELPEEARPLAEARRAQGLQTHGRPLLVGPDWTADRAEGLADAACYGIADAARLLAAGDEAGALRLAYAASTHMVQAVHGPGVEHLAIHRALWRAVQALARGHGH